MERQREGCLVRRVERGRLGKPAGYWSGCAFTCGSEGEFQRFRLVTDLPRSKRPPLLSFLFNPVVAAFLSDVATLQGFFVASA